MADVRPLHGVHYNQSLVGDLSAVICPPYDIISPQMQQELYHRSQYNFVRLEYNRELPQDTAADNKYTRSAAILEQWLRQGILQIDEAPAFYLHDHNFAYQGKKYRRRGIIARVRLEEWDRMVVRPHEGTMAEPRGDRLSLLWALQANTSSILALFQDRKQHISSLLAAGEKEKPLFRFSMADEERHEVWAITDAETINEICRSLAEQPLYIADGHHRYESALAYRREQAARAPAVSGDEGFNFVMMTLVDFADPGLLILPPHRLVRGVSKPVLDELPARLKLFFAMEKLPLNASDVWQKVDGFLAGESDEVRLVLFGPGRESLFLLRLHNFDAASQMMPYFHSELYKKLNVSIVDHVILEELLGLTQDKGGASLAYSYDKLDTVSKVLDQEFQLAFILSPVKPETIKAIADVDDRMPRKSTYFYPKLPSGLVFHRLV